ncbi:MAG: butyrate kinase [Armatimonadota bacterium]|nr:MAG: butyrate kinase [Armatimonadota bacterium]
MREPPSQSLRPTINAASEIHAVSDLVIVAGALEHKSVVVAGGDRVADLLLVEAAQDHGIVDRVILVGDERLIRDAIEQTHVMVDPADIIAAADDRDTAAKTVACAQSGDAGIIIKGGTPTPALYRELLKIRIRPTISVVACFDAAPIAEGRLMMLTDPGITVLCTYARMVDIIESAADVARVVFGRARPKVAIISANEEDIKALASSRIAAELTRHQWQDMEVYGPLSFDLAVDPQSVKVKRLIERFPECASVAGQADILAFTNIDAANAVYKAIMAMSDYGAASLANITVGLEVPVAPVSRSELLSSRLASIALTSVYTQLRPSGERRTRGHALLTRASGRHRVLVINPGSTSTKLSFFHGEGELNAGEVRHAPASSDPSDDIRNRLALVREFLADHAIANVDAIVGRGGLLPRGKRKLEAGVYEIARVENGQVIVDDALVEAITRHAELEHPCNLGIPLAAEVARELGVPAFMIDPVVADEFMPEAEISGYAPVPRRSAAHFLSVKETARRAAEELGHAVDQINLIVAHLGGGITVAALRHNRMIDATISLLGDGPFSPQRAGRLPLKHVIGLAYSGKFTREQLERELSTRGGLRSYLGTYDLEEIARRIAAGDETARQVVEAMVYWVAKEIGALAITLGGEVDAIAVTGGMARSEAIVDQLRSRIGHLAPVVVFPESLEMQAMAAGACRALSGEEPIKRWADYAPEPPPSNG